MLTLSQLGYGFKGCSDVNVDDNMSSPLLKKRKFQVDGDPPECVICTKECKEKQKNPNNEHWWEFHEVAKEWEVLRGHKYYYVLKRVCWEAGPAGHLWHKTCKWQMMNKKTLDQATRSYQSHVQSHAPSIGFDCSENSPTDTPDDASKTNTRLSTGAIYEKQL